MGKRMLFFSCRKRPLYLNACSPLAGRAYCCTGHKCGGCGFLVAVTRNKPAEISLLNSLSTWRGAVQILLEKPFIPKISIVIFANAMTKSEILQTLAAHRDELARMGVKTLAVFGSVARDEARVDSDVDILVEFQGPATFNGYMDLKFFLEDLLGRSVDLVTRKSIRPRLKTLIE